MRFALFLLLLAAFTHAGAQRSVLFAELPDGVDSKQAVEVARQVLIARGWTLVPEDGGSVEGRKDNSGVSIFARGHGLLYSDLSLRSRGRSAREHRESGPQLAAIPQAEIDALRADLESAFAGKLPLAGVEVPTVPGQVLISVAAGADPQEVMKAAREAFVGRRWKLKDEPDGGFLADIRGAQESATLKVFLADGTLRFIDRSADRKGQKSQAPERWLNNVRADLRSTMVTLAPQRKPAARATAPAQGDAAERLRTLKSMLDAGLISEAEYDGKRAEILKGL